MKYLVFYCEDFDPEPLRRDCALFDPLWFRLEYRDRLNSIIINSVNEFLIILFFLLKLYLNYSTIINLLIKYFVHTEGQFTSEGIIQRGNLCSGRSTSFKISLFIAFYLSHLRRM